MRVAPPPTPSPYAPNLESLWLPDRHSIERAAEALAAGALLFQDAGNREVFDFLEDGKECVAYTVDNLIPLAQHYLAHEDERRSIAEAGRAQHTPDLRFRKSELFS